MPCHIRKNDVVEVISGDHRGARGKVLRVDRKHGRVVVEGVNMVFRHVRPTRKNPQGGRLQKEAPLDWGKVLPYDPSKGKGRRVHFAVERDASSGRVKEKRRVTSAGTVLNVLSRGKRGQAK
jgi:large subunit ribosomal protein L24